MTFPARRRPAQPQESPHVTTWLSAALRARLHERWASDVTEHPTKEGKVYCCAVMDTCRRRIVDWPIDTVHNWSSTPSTCRSIDGPCGR